MNIAPDRDTLRAVQRARRFAFPADQREAARSVIMERLLTWEPVKTARVLAVYRAATVEVNVDGLALQALQSGRSVAVPAFDPSIRGYRFVFQKPDTVWTAGPFGIEQPEDFDVCDASCVELAIVPGLAFDGKGNRLGHGKGYYDRLLAGCPAIRVGVAFDLQVVDCIPPRDGDEAMDWIITESRTLSCGMHSPSGRSRTLSMKPPGGSTI